jgi:signal transduction histidine kinase/phage shock protein PspC (stress-responsive transcriptional regulator)
MTRRMTRSTNRILAGVAAGLADHLGMKVGVVRLVFVASAFFFGAGVFFYAWLWVLVPVAGEGVGQTADTDDQDEERLRLYRPAPGPPQAAPMPAAGAQAPGRRFPGGAKEVLLGLGLVALALFLVAQGSGLNLQLGTVLPLAVIAAGAVLAWMQLDETRRSGFMNAARADKPAGALRLAAGLVLVVAGVLVIVAGGRSWDLVWPAALASVAVLAGVGLVLAPWMLKFWRDLQAERAGRIREAERAEIAAHLHDSVLQTLALIQRRADSAQDVVRLARAQERELRSWLYQDAGRGDENLVHRVKAVAAELEDAYGHPVEVIGVGDALMTERTEALVQATREALLNAVRHAGTAVSVYVEATPNAIEVFVKDRGAGFDQAAIAPDRLGVRESVVGRMQRNGGTAVIVSSAEGTEVRLRLPMESVLHPRSNTTRPRREEQEHQA